jgi:tetratricopeptide (TPR) repeat protein
MGQKFGASLLTLFGAAMIAGGVWATMHYTSLRAAPEYWLVPVFGALGGFVGGIIRAENKLELCAFESASKVNLGILGDIVAGLGGASALTFVFGGTLLNFNSSDGKPQILLVSVSLVGGVVGRRVIEKASEKLLNEGKIRQIAQAEAANLISRPAATVYTSTATNMINKGLYVEEALEVLKSALDSDPTYTGAWVEKGRALKKLGRVKEALDAVDQALKIDPKKVEALYNRACYLALLGGDVGSIADDLKKSFELSPPLREIAKTDHDLDSVRNDMKIKELIEVAPKTT